MDELHESLQRNGLLVILRAGGEASLVDVVTALVESGVRALEITLNTPGALAAVREITAPGRLPEDVLVGVGTVRRPDAVAEAKAAGARFIVSPVFRPSIVDAAVEAKLGCLPGVFTPTEIHQAWEHGPSAVKLFPAGSLGPGYVSAVRAPMPDIPIVPTGGVRLSDVDPYRKAGALAVAVGSPVLGDALRGGSLDELRSRAREFVAEAGAA